MATSVLRLGKAVNDPTNKFPFVTDMGLTSHVELSAFTSAQASAGSLVAGEFSALNTYITALKAVGLWDKVKESYPFIGAGLSGATIKLKKTFSNTALVPYTQGPTNFLDSDLTKAGGRVTRIASAAAADNNGKMMRSGVTANNLKDGFAFHIYTDLSTCKATGSNQVRNLMGASVMSAVGTHQIYAGFDFSSGDATPKVKTQFFSSVYGPSALTAGKTKGLYSFVFTVSGGNVVIAIYWNGVPQYTSPSGAFALSTSDLTREIYLFGKNPFGTSVAQTFDGSTAHMAFTDALTAAEVTAYYNALLPLLTALGKAEPS